MRYFGTIIRIAIMAMRSKLEALGVDVAKDWLDIFNGEMVDRVE